MTVRRRLRENGLRNVRPEKKPRLTASMRKKRLEWAKRQTNWSMDDWKQVVFSDESSLEVKMQINLNFGTRVIEVNRGYQL